MEKFKAESAAAALELRAEEARIFGIDVSKTVRGLGWELEVVQRKGDPAKNITAVFVE